MMNYHNSVITLTFKNGALRLKQTKTGIFFELFRSLKKYLKVSLS